MKKYDVTVKARQKVFTSIVTLYYAYGDEQSRVKVSMQRKNPELRRIPVKEMDWNIKEV